MFLGLRKPIVWGKRMTDKEYKEYDKNDTGIRLKLDWQIPDYVPTHRVTNATVQRMGDEFVLSFFEHRGPIIISDEDVEKARQEEFAKVLCVARICITPERMASFIKVFKQQYDLYLQSKSNVTSPLDK